MAFILLIETATNVCSVGLLSQNELISVREDDGASYSHSSKLTIFIEEVMQESGISFEALSAVAVGQGPGSYTGLRIGISAAKGICYALDIPLIAVDTLETLTRQVLPLEIAVPKMRGQPSLPKIFCPMIDARRMEVYYALFDKTANPLCLPKAEIITSNSFDTLLEDNTVFFMGNGSTKCEPLINHPNAIFIAGVTPSVKGMAGRTIEKFQKKDFENLAYFEPFYLKDFIAGTPRVKGLH